MRNFPKIALIFLIAVISCLFLYFSQRTILVLEYHSINNSHYVCSVNPDLFEREMKFLKDHGYTAISLSQFSSGLIDYSCLPPKPVLITFDDGYEDNYTNALPIMEKYGMHGTEFVIVNDVGQPGYLTWEQIEDMKRRKTDIESHTLSHRALKDLSREEQKQELYVSKLLLEKHLHCPVEYVAYPYGSYNEDTVELLGKLGYKEAFSSFPGVNTSMTNHYVIKRVPVLQPKTEMVAFGLKELKLSFSKR